MTVFTNPNIMILHTCIRNTTCQNTLHVLPQPSYDWYDVLKRMYKQLNLHVTQKCIYNVYQNIDMFIPILNYNQKLYILIIPYDVMLKECTITMMYIDFIVDQLDSQVKKLTKRKMFLSWQDHGKKWKESGGKVI